MNFFTPAEIVKNYGAAGKKKAEMPLLKMLILGFLSGMFIALGAAVTNTAGHSIDNVSAVRMCHSKNNPPAMQGEESSLDERTPMLE